MPSHQDDEIAEILAGLVDRLFQHITLDDDRKVMRFALIATSLDGPGELRMTEEVDSEVSYEVIEGPDRIFITADLPPLLTTAPYVDINPDRIILFVEGRRTVVDLPVKIDITRSSYQIRRRTMDILCYKK